MNVNGVDPEALLASLIKGDAKEEALKSCFSGMQHFLHSREVEDLEPRADHELPDYDSFYSGLAVVRYVLEAEQAEKYLVDASELLAILREALAMDDPLSLASALDSLLLCAGDKEKRELLLSHLRILDFDPDGDVLLVALEHIKSLFTGGEVEGRPAKEDAPIFEKLCDLLNNSELDLWVRNQIYRTLLLVEGKTDEEMPSEYELFEEGGSEFLSLLERVKDNFF